MTNKISNRRDFLGSLASVAALLSGCSEQPEGGTDTPTATWTGTPTSSPPATPTDIPTETGSETETETQTEAPEEWTVDPLEHDKLIGAHHYSWYWGEEGYGVHRSEGWLNHTPAEPALGQYDSRNPDVTNQHIKWALEEAGINWFIETWGQPGSRLDRTIRNTVMEAELAQYMDFSLLMGFPSHYSRNDEGEFDFDLETNRSRLKRDIRHFADYYFSKSNYLEIDGKPVLYVYGANPISGDIKGAFEQAKETAGTDVYLIADPWMRQPATATNLEGVFDAISEYNPYSPKEGVRENFTEDVVNHSKAWRLWTEENDLGYFPTVIPGYNDTAISWGKEPNPILERDMERFEGLCERTLDTMDPDLDGFIVTSFNEDPEMTLVEKQKPKNDGEELRDDALDIIGRSVAKGNPDYMDTQKYLPLELRFNKTVTPGGGDWRELALAAGELSLFEEGGTEVASYDIGIAGEEPLLAEGFYAPEKGDIKISDWRWLGGPTKNARVYIPQDIGDLSEAVIYGDAVTRDISADVRFNGQKTDSVNFDEGLSNYSFNLG